MSTKNKSENKTTEIAYILDRSSSMGHLSEAAICGFNEFLSDQQKAEGVARLTLVLFDDQYEVPADNIPVAEMLPLNAKTYYTRGCTALLDAIGRTVKSFKKRIKSLPEKDRPDKVIFAIYTDGEENSSEKYNWKAIAKMIRKRKKKDGWEFLFLAANQDAVATAAKMSINASDAAATDFSEAGMRTTNRAFSRKVRALRRDDPGEADCSKSLSDIVREEE